MLPGSAACNSCSPGNKAFNVNGGHTGSNASFGAGCGPRNCGSRNGGSGPIGNISITKDYIIEEPDLAGVGGGPSLTKTMINNARQLSRSLVGIYH